MRLDDAFLKQRGGVMFFTCGSLREMIKLNPNLEGISHVIVDEVHERSIDNDVLLLLLKLALDRAGFRLVLMSATAKVDALREYFGTDAVVRVQEGKPFPVETFYLDQIKEALPSGLDCMATRTKGGPVLNQRLVAEVVRFIHGTKPPGAILVFLPGWGDIKVSFEGVTISSTLPPLPPEDLCMGELDSGGENSLLSSQALDSIVCGLSFPLFL